MSHRKPLIKNGACVVSHKRKQMLKYYIEDSIVLNQKGPNIRWSSGLLTWKWGETTERHSPTFLMTEFFL